MVNLQADPTSSSSHLQVDSTSIRLDFSSTFYLHPSVSVGSSRLPIVFYGTGYRSWRRAVLRTLSVKSKTRFINGTLVRPALADPSFLQWERCDDMLQKEINDLVQVVKLYKAEQDRRLIHFLMGLNEVYTAIRVNILLMSTLPREVETALATLAPTLCLEAALTLMGPLCFVITMNRHQNEEDPELKRQMPLNLSKDQYEQMLNLLGTLQVGNGTSSSNNLDNMINGAVNLACICHDPGAPPSRNRRTRPRKGQIQAS
ncbi:hypothetical protein KY284_033120 [Solanum tuberosum]|nr:hypothetical protein KY284_033120 [Solanum tuberosum]